MTAVNRSVTGEPEPLRYEGACGDVAPDGVARCVLLADHYGNHAHAPDRTADWRGVATQWRRVVRPSTDHRHARTSSLS